MPSTTPLTYGYMSADVCLHPSFLRVRSSLTIAPLDHSPSLYVKRNAVLQKEYEIYKEGERERKKERKKKNKNGLLSLFPIGSNSGYVLFCWIFYYTLHVMSSHFAHLVSVIDKK